jgi:Mg-chelatase subunit ChlD
LTSDRTAIVTALRSLDQSGSTNIGGGIQTALEGFAAAGREGSSRVILVFTDGRSNAKKARLAMNEAQKQGVAVHSLLLGSDRWGKAILEEITEGTGGSFIQVKDPTSLPEAFLSLRTTGVDNITVQVNESPPIPAQLTMGTFTAEIPVVRGENHIVATATSIDGRTRTDTITVMVQPPGCAEIEVQAMRGGKPVLSVSQRSVEIVVDASRSMWGQIDGVSKMEIARQTLEEALDWLPPDLMLSLRAYGSQHKREAFDCKDTKLLVASSSNNRDEIRAAVSQLRPNGQTPLGYALEQVPRDFAGFRGERAVVLVTDGIESCQGNAPAAARALQARGPVPVHVIGFGLGNAEDEDLASLRAIADASGGKFLTAGSAEELRNALSTTVGTPFRILRGKTPVSRGTLGANEVVRLPAGEYRVRLDSTPPQEVPIDLESEVRHTLVFQKESGSISHTAWRNTADYALCEESTPAAIVKAPPTAEAEPESEPASGSAPKKRSQAKSKRKASWEIPDGKVEIWQNLRPERTSDWGVVLRHPSVKKGVSMVWKGDDLAVAEEVARGLRDTMQRMDAVKATDQ